MHIRSACSRVSMISTLLLAFFSVVKEAYPATVILDFDSVAISGIRTDGTAYLNSFGVTFVPITPGITPSIENTLASGSAAIASSPPNVFDAVGLAGPGMLFYRLDFATPLVSVSFTRAAIVPTSGDPPWLAEALDAQGNVLASANEGFLIGPSARTVTFTAAGITSLAVFARNDVSQTTFNTPPIDNLTLVTAAPEPESAVLFVVGLGILMLGIMCRQPRKDRPAAAQ